MIDYLRIIYSLLYLAFCVILLHSPFPYAGILLIAIGVVCMLVYIAKKIEKKCADSNDL